MFLDILMHLRSTIFTFTGESVDSDELEESFNDFLSSWGMSRDTILKLGTFGVLKEVGVGFHVYLDRLGHLGEARIGVDLNPLRFNLLYSEYLTERSFTDEEMNEIHTCSCLNDGKWADMLLLSLDNQSLNSETALRVMVHMNMQKSGDPEILKHIFAKLSIHASGRVVEKSLKEIEK